MSMTAQDYRALSAIIATEAAKHIAAPRNSCDDAKMDVLLDIAAAIAKYCSRNPRFDTERFMDDCRLRSASPLHSIAYRSGGN